MPAGLIPAHAGRSPGAGCAAEAEGLTHAPRPTLGEGEFFGFVLRRVARGQQLPYRELVPPGARIATTVELLHPYIDAREYPHGTKIRLIGGAEKLVR